MRSTSIPGFRRSPVPPPAAAVDLDAHLHQLIRQRTPEGSLLSMRIPVTEANRQLLQELRAAELAAWEKAE